MVEEQSLKTLDGVRALPELRTHGRESRRLVKYKCAKCEIFYDVMFDDDDIVVFMDRDERLKRVVWTTGGFMKTRY